VAPERGRGAGPNTRAPAGCPRYSFARAPKLPWVSLSRIPRLRTQRPASPLSPPAAEAAGGHESLPRRNRAARERRLGGGPSARNTLHMQAVRAAPHEGSVRNRPAG